MNDKPQKSKIKWIEKLKNIKHIEIYITLIFAIILILIFLSSTNSKTTTTNYAKSTDTKQQTIATYVDNMEAKLEQILSQVQGASNVSVMLTLDMTNSSVQDNIIKTEKFPEIKGIIIVANGVDKTAVKMNILKAVQTVIDISNGRIEILSRNWL